MSDDTILGLDVPEVHLPGGMIQHHVSSITETLGGLAAQYYGDWRLWRYIADHNEDVIGLNVNHLTPGTVLVIPYHASMRVPTIPAFF